MRIKNLVFLFAVFIVLFSFTKTSFSKVNNITTLGHKTYTTVMDSCFCILVGEYSRYYNYKILNVYFKHVVISTHVILERVLEAKNIFNKNEGIIIIQLMFNSEKENLVTTLGPIIQITEIQVTEEKILLKHLFFMPKIGIYNYLKNF